MPKSLPVFQMPLTARRIEDEDADEDEEDGDDLDGGDDLDRGNF